MEAERDAELVLTAEQEAELDRRWAEHLADPGSAIPSEDIRRKLLAREFGPLLETAIRGGSVVITKHDTPKAVLLSMAEFEALGGSRPPDLNALGDEFNSLLARLQTPRARKALKSAFDATPKELGRLAVAQQRRRG